MKPGWKLIGFGRTSSDDWKFCVKMNFEDSAEVALVSNILLAAVKLHNSLTQD